MRVSGSKEISRGSGRGSDSESAAAAFSPGQKPKAAGGEILTSVQPLDASQVEEVPTQLSSQLSQSSESGGRDSETDFFAFLYLKINQDEGVPNKADLIESLRADYNQLKEASMEEAAFRELMEESSAVYQEREVGFIGSASGRVHEIEDFAQSAADGVFECQSRMKVQGIAFQEDMFDEVQSKHLAAATHFLKQLPYLKIIPWLKDSVDSAIDWTIIDKDVFMHVGVSDETLKSNEINHFQEQISALKALEAKFGQSQEAEIKYMQARLTKINKEKIKQANSIFAYFNGQPCEMANLKHMYDVAQTADENVKKNFLENMEICKAHLKRILCDEGFDFKKDLSDEAFLAAYFRFYESCPEAMLLYNKGLGPEPSDQKQALERFKKTVFEEKTDDSDRGVSGSGVIEDSLTVAETVSHLGMLQTVLDQIVEMQGIALSSVAHQGLEMMGMVGHLAGSAAIALTLVKGFVVGEEYEAGCKAFLDNVAQRYIQNRLGKSNVAESLPDPNRIALEGDKQALKAKLLAVRENSRLMGMTSTDYKLFTRIIRGVQNEEGASESLTNFLLEKIDKCNKEEFGEIKELMEGTALNLGLNLSWDEVD